MSNPEANNAPHSAQALEALTAINLDDLVSSFGWQAMPLPARLLRMVFRPPAREFARWMLAFDALTGQKSLPEGARFALRDFAARLEVYGAQHLPAAGPVLVLSNHPGMVDTLALFAAIQRTDLRILALDRPFLQSLPNVAARLHFLGEDPQNRTSAVRQAAGHLRKGGALLTFPAGQIEPDPLVYPGALQALEGWTDSAGVFLRFAPETVIVPALVSGVLWERAVKFPLTRIKKEQFDREKLGASLQLLAHILFRAHPLKIRVQFARPITLAEVGSADMLLLHRLVLERMRGLIENPPTDAGVRLPL